ncbi:2EXR family [Microdochium nivale]|nr:2EXR family [Microdochium nivale]
MTNTATVTTATTFHHFPALPPELRIQIWSLAVVGPRFVVLDAQKLDRHTDWLSFTPPPAVMRVCCEARAPAPYTRAFVTASGSATHHARYAWVNFNVDMVVVRIIGKQGEHGDPLKWLAGTASAENIQRLRFSVRTTGENDFNSFVGYLGWTLKRYQSLRELQIVIPWGQAGLYVEVASDTTIKDWWCGTCMSEDVHFVDRATGLLLTVSEARLQTHWDYYNGGLLTEDEKEDFDWHAEKFWESWLEQVENVLYHNLRY